MSRLSAKLRTSRPPLIYRTVVCILFVGLAGCDVALLETKGDAEVTGEIEETSGAAQIVGEIEDRSVEEIEERTGDAQIVGEVEETRGDSGDVEIIGEIEE